MDDAAAVRVVESLADGAQDPLRLCAFDEDSRRSTLKMF